MKLFSEKVTPTFTNSSFNILQVEKFQEIFFDVYEIELNKIKYPVEKVSEYKGSPVVSVPVVIGEKEQKYPFILTKGKLDVIFNENNIHIPSEDGNNIELVSETIIHEVEPDVEEFEDISIPEFEIDNAITEDAKASLKLEIAKQLKEAKKTAVEYAEKIKSQKINEATQDIKKRERVLKNTLDNAKADLISEFVKITKKIREDILKVNNNRYSEISQTVDNKIVDLAESLRDSISDNFSDAAEKFEKSVSEFVINLHENSTLPEVRKTLTDISSDIVSKFSSIEEGIKEDFYKKLENKADADIVDALRESTIELNSNINKGLNKALSRVGNTNNKIDKVAVDIISEMDKKIYDTSSDIISQIDEKIEIASSNISNYYSDKLKFIEEQAYDLNEKSRKYVAELVQESRDGLIKEIRKLQKETPIEYVIESSGKREVKSFDSINSELDKKISSKISDEVIRLKKFIAVYSGGGGSVAQQFADGGIMNGNLTVVGAISASQYLGISIPSGEYLSLSGGFVNGNVTINGTLSATVIDALSANVTVIDIKQYELSGFNVQGNATVQGSVSASGSVFGSNIVYNGGNTTTAALSVGTNSDQSLIFETNSLSRMTITSAGNVGIGTSNLNSNSKLTVAGTLVAGNGNRSIVDTNDVGYFENASNYTQFQIYNPASNTRAYFSVNNTGSSSMGGVTDSSAGAQIWTLSPRRLSFGTNALPRMTILSGGNIGIGTISPNETLTVSGNISSTAIIRASRMGLGVTSLPSSVILGVGPNIISDSNLPVQYSSTTDINYIGLNAQGSGYGGLLGFTQGEFGGGLIVRTVQSTGGVSNITFVTQNTNQRMKIVGTTGNVGIATTTPNERLTVSGNISATGTVTGSNLVYNIGDQTIGGVKTFSDNIIGNGSLNRLPNQTLSNDAILNYRLGQIIQNTQSLQLAPFAGGWSNLTPLSANTSIFTDRGFVRLDAANNLGFSGITAVVISGEVISIGENVNGRDNYINLSGRVGVSFLIKSGGDPFDPSLQDWAYAFGSYDAITDHNITTLYPFSQSTSGYRAYVCVTCNGGQVRLRVCDKNGTRVDSGVLETITGIKAFSRSYAVVLDGGTAYLYKNRTLLGQVSGASTFNDLNGSYMGALFNHTAYATGTALRRRLFLVDSKVWWETI
jgi:hypothetical protein